MKRNSLLNSHRYLPQSISLHFIRYLTIMEYGDPYPRRNLPLYVTLILLSTTAVVLRLVVRIKTKTTLRGDDWWACLSLVLLHAYLGAYIWGKFRVSVAIILFNPFSSSFNKAICHRTNNGTCHRIWIMDGRRQSLMANLQGMLANGSCFSVFMAHSSSLANICSGTDFYFYDFSSENKYNPPLS